MTIGNTASVVSKLRPQAPRYPARSESQTQLVAVREETIESAFADLAYLFDATGGTPAPSPEPANDDEPPEEPTVVHLDPRLVAATRNAEAAAPPPPRAKPTSAGMRALRSTVRPPPFAAPAALPAEPAPEPPACAAPEPMGSPEPALAPEPVAALEPLSPEPPPAAIAPIRSRRPYARAALILAGACLAAIVPSLAQRSLAWSTAASAASATYLASPAAATPAPLQTKR